MSDTGSASVGERQENATTLRVVVVLAEPRPHERYAIEKTIAAQLADLNVDIIFENELPLSTDDTIQTDEMAGRLISATDAAAVFVISSGAHQSMRIVFAGDAHPQATTRAVEVTTGMPWHEALAVIVRSTTVSMLEQKAAQETVLEDGAAAGENNQFNNARPDTVADSGNAKPASADKWQGGLYIGSGVVLDFFARDTGPAPGMGIGGGWRLTRHWEIQVGAVALLSSSASQRGTRLTLKRFPVWLGAGYMKRRGRFMAGGGGGLRLDIVTEQIFTDNPRTSPEPGGVEAHVAVHLYLRAGWWLNRFICFYTDLGAAFQLTRNDYGIATPDGNRVLVAPLPVQPSILIGLQLHFF